MALLKELWLATTYGPALVCPNRCFGGRAFMGILLNTISPGINCRRCRVLFTCSSDLRWICSLCLWRIPAIVLKLQNSLAQISVWGNPFGTMNGARVTSGPRISSLPPSLTVTHIHPLSLNLADPHSSDHSSSPLTSPYQAPAPAGPTTPPRCSSGESSSSSAVEDGSVLWDRSDAGAMRPESEYNR